MERRLKDYGFLDFSFGLLLQRFQKTCFCCVSLLDFRLKNEQKWIPMYELAKVSLNNKGNEIRSAERRSKEKAAEEEEANFQN